MGTGGDDREASRRGLRRLAQGFRLLRIGGLAGGLCAAAALLGAGLDGIAAASIASALFLAAGAVGWFAGLGLLRGDGTGRTGRRLFGFGRVCLLLLLLPLPVCALARPVPALGQDAILAVGSAQALLVAALVATALAVGGLSRAAGSRHVGPTQARSAIGLTLVLAAVAGTLLLAVREVPGGDEDAIRRLAVALGVTALAFRLPLAWMVELSEGLEKAMKAPPARRSAWGDFDERLRTRSAERAAAGRKDERAAAETGTAPPDAVPAETAPAEAAAEPPRRLPPDAKDLLRALRRLTFGLASLRMAGTLILLGAFVALPFRVVGILVWTALTGLVFATGLVFWTWGLAAVRRRSSNPTGWRYLTFSLGCLALAPFSLAALFDVSPARGAACVALSVAALVPAALIGTGLGLKEISRDIRMKRVGSYFARRSAHLTAVFGIVSISLFAAIVWLSADTLEELGVILATSACLTLLLYRSTLLRLTQLSESLADALQAEIGEAVEQAVAPETATETRPPA